MVISNRNLAETNLKRMVFTRSCNWEVQTPAAGTVGPGDGDLVKLRTYIL